MASAARPSSRLLCLPVEVRLRIFQYLFHGAKAFFHYDNTSAETRLTSEDCHKSILSVCTQIYIEAKLLLAESISLTINPDRRISSLNPLISYPEQLTGYQLYLRELRLEDLCDPRNLKIDSVALPKLATVTYSGSKFFAIEFRRDVYSEAEAVAWLTGRHDQNFAKIRMHPTNLKRRKWPDPLYLSSTWLSEQLKIPNRGYQLRKEDYYEFEIEKKQDGLKIGSIYASIRLTFDVETHAVVSKVPETCEMWGRWSDETIKLCASINRDSTMGKTTWLDDEDEDDTGGWFHPF